MSFNWQRMTDSRLITQSLNSKLCSHYDNELLEDLAKTDATWVAEFGFRSRFGLGRFEEVTLVLLFQEKEEALFLETALLHEDCQLSEEEKEEVLAKIEAVSKSPNLPSLSLFWIRTLFIEFKSKFITWQRLPEGYVHEGPLSYEGEYLPDNTTVNGILSSFRLKALRNLQAKSCVLKGSQLLIDNLVTGSLSAKEAVIDLRGPLTIVDNFWLKQFKQQMPNFSCSSLSLGTESNDTEPLIATEYNFSQALVHEFMILYNCAVSYANCPDIRLYSNVTGLSNSQAHRIYVGVPNDLQLISSVNCDLLIVAADNLVNPKVFDIQAELTVLRIAEKKEFNAYFDSGPSPDPDHIDLTRLPYLRVNGDLQTEAPVRLPENGVVYGDLVTCTKPKIPSNFSILGSVIIR